MQNVAVERVLTNYYPFYCTFVSFHETRPRKGYPSRLITAATAEAPRLLESLLQMILGTTEEEEEFIDMSYRL